MTELSDDRLNEAFGALSHELRLTVLDVLERELGTRTFGSSPLAYSDLVDRIESHMADESTFDPANLTYHLRKLREAGFVQYADSGYRITQAGVRIVRAIRAGDIATDETFDAVPIEEPCPYCGGESVLTIEDEWLFVTCLDCHGAFAQDPQLPAGTLAGFQISPAAVRDRSPRELFVMAFRVGLQVHRLFADGICPTCNGTTTTELLDCCEAHTVPDSGVCPTCNRTTDEFLVVTCDVCGRSLMTFPAIVVATDPAVIAELYTRGRDLTNQTWLALSHPPDWPSEYVSSDPVCIEYTIPVPTGEPLTVQLDADLTVTLISAARD